MKARKRDNRYVLRLEKGEDIIPALKEFCEAHDIRSGIIQGIGSVSEVELGLYHLGRKVYSFKKIKKPLEIASLSGNVSVFQEEFWAHLHGVFGDEEGVAYAGHVKSAIVSGTCEMYLIQDEEAMDRKFDEDSGLYLWDI